MNTTQRIGRSESAPAHHATLRRALRRRLLTLDFHAFARTVALMLERAGYEEVRLVGRVHYRGTNGKGVPAGYDLTAAAPPALDGPARRIIVRAKQYDAQSIPQKTIDELRGVCLRAGASEALLVTTGPVAPSVLARLSKAADAPVAPVAVIGGEPLLDLLILHRVGVWEEARPDGSPSRVELDTSYFADLSRSRVGNGPGDHARGPKYLVTVDVKPLRAGGKGGRKYGPGPAAAGQSSRLTLFAR